MERHTTRLLLAALLAVAALGFWAAQESPWGSSVVPKQECPPLGNEEDIGARADTSEKENSTSELSVPAAGQTIRTDISLVQDLRAEVANLLADNKRLRLELNKRLDTEEAHQEELRLMTSKYWSVRAFNADLLWRMYEGTLEVPLEPEDARTLKEVLFANIGFDITKTPGLVDRFLEEYKLVEPRLNAWRIKWRTLDMSSPKFLKQKEDLIKKKDTIREEFREALELHGFGVEDSRILAERL